MTTVEDEKMNVELRSIKGGSDEASEKQEFHRGVMPASLDCQRKRWNNFARQS